jgi:uncharacterized protein (UPF0335 family)
VTPVYGQFTRQNIALESAENGGTVSPTNLVGNGTCMRADTIKEMTMDETSTTETVAAAELRQFIERVERLEEEKAAISGDIKDVMGEAKGRGYDTKAIRTIIRLRKKDANERIEEETILQTYMAALGME